MNIEYMKQVKENPALKGFKNEPMTISEITQLEVKYNQGREFPKAFREFLYLAGNYNCYHFDDLGEGLEQLQEYAKEDLEKTEQEVKDAFFAFSVYDSQYSVIFLDDDKADPEVFIIDPYEAKEGGMLIRPNGWKFADLVNESIRRVKNNIPA